MADLPRVCNHEEDWRGTSWGLYELFQQVLLLAGVSREKVSKGGLIRLTNDFLNPTAHDSDSSSIWIGICYEYTR